MKIRIYIKDLKNEEFVKILDKDLHYLKNVLKVKINDEIIIFNENGEFKYLVKDINKNYIHCQFLNFERQSENLPKIHLMQSIIKGEKMSEVIENAVQAGVTEFTPILSDNCYIRNVNIEKLYLNAKTALQQSNGMNMIKINEPIKFAEVKELINKDDLLLYGNLSAKKDSINNILNKVKLAQQISILIGPEGGFSEREINDMDKMKNSIGIQIGSRIFRAESASLAILAAINLIISYS